MTSKNRAALLALAAATSLACSSQYADPILDAPADPLPTSCPTAHVLALGGNSFGTAARLIQDDFTIEAWISTNTSPSGAGFAEGSALVFADVETMQVNDFAAATLNGKFVMTVGGPDTPATSTSRVATGHWVHVAATRQKSDGIVLVYVAGVLEASAVGNLNSLGDAPNISVGGRAKRNFFTGLMSDLRLWSVVRSQRELTADMNERLNGNEPGLVGYYRFDETTGTTAHDSSPSGNDLVFSAPVTWPESPSPFCPP